MGERTSIEWADATWTPVRARDRKTGKVGWHCEHVSEACRWCYAEGMNRRLGTGLDYKPGNRSKIELFLDEKMLRAPLHWRKPRRIFVCSTTDLFADFVPDEWIDRVFAVMALCPQHTFQVLTKRPARMREYLSARSPDLHLRVWARANPPGTLSITAHEAECRLLPGINQEARRLYHASEPIFPLPNVWLGTSIEDQATADERVPLLLDTPAVVRFVSAEPLLGPIDLTSVKLPNGDILNALTGEVHDPKTGCIVRELESLDWVIVGGESGPHARPMHPDWARSLRDQCTASRVPFLFKQWGEWSAVLDRQVQDPDWRADYVNDFPNRGATRWLNLEGGQGFHGERFHVMKRVGKKAAGALLDGREWRQSPEAAA